MRFLTGAETKRPVQNAGYNGQKPDQAPDACYSGHFALCLARLSANYMRLATAINARGPLLEHMLQHHGKCRWYLVVLVFQACATETRNAIATISLAIIQIASQGSSAAGYSPERVPAEACSGGSEAAWVK